MQLSLPQQLPWQPLFSLRRSGVVEVTHYGQICVWQPTPTLTLPRKGGGENVSSLNSSLCANHQGANLLMSVGDVTAPLWSRSLLKPFQLYSLMPSLQGLNLSSQDLALLMASQNGDAEQLSRLSELFDRFGLSQTTLQTPSMYPMSGRNASTLKGEGKDPCSLYHPCSGKHLAYLLAAKQQGLNLETYLAFDSPLYTPLTDWLGQVLARPVSALGVDGCGMPNVALSVSELVQLFYALTQDRDAHWSSLTDAMQAYPELLGGQGRLDTRLIQGELTQAGFRVFAKEGADGLLGIGIGATPQYPKGLGIVIKLASGYNSDWLELLAAQVLTELGLLNPDYQSPVSLPRAVDVVFHFPAVLMKDIIDISQPVNAQTACFPGDVPFSRQVTLTHQDSGVINLTSFTMSPHVGTHADAPVHIAGQLDDSGNPEGGYAAVGALSLSPYLGSCLVVDALQAHQRAIVWEDIQEQLMGLALIPPRLLFKTQSKPDYTVFEERYAWFSPDLIEHLASLGVQLVGIDTPSVDAVDSKSLETHHCLLQHHMSWLENLDLSDADTGAYWLSALPLRLESLEAAPVRAVLLR